MYDGLQEEYLTQFRLQDEDREAVRYQQIYQAGEQPAAPVDAQADGRQVFQRPGWTAALRGLFGLALGDRVAH
jgi:hypothetical protein